MTRLPTMMRLWTFLTLSALPAWTLSASSQPNIVLFSIDSCRADRFGVYGNQPSPTQAIDDWAAGSAVFDSAYSTSAWTAPGLVSILTGLYPPTHGINNRDRMGSPELATLMKIFRGSGYDVPNLNFFTFAPYYVHLGLGPVDRQYFGDRPGQELVRYLESRLPGRPFFVWYHTTMVHQPYDPGPQALPAPREELFKRPGIRAAMSGAIVPRGSAEFQEGDRELLLALYDGELKRVDALFQQVLTTLRERGLLDNTLIVLTADHGEELLDHGFIGHASTSLQAKLFEELVHIPLMVGWPQKVSAGHRAGLVNQTDILPTILDLAEVALPKGVQGKDLLAEGGPQEGKEGAETARDRDKREDRALFFESAVAGNQTTKERENLWLRGMRQGVYKYISDGQLYRLDEDPGEERNRIGDEPEVAARMKTRLESWLGDATAAGKALFHSGQEVVRATSADCPVIHTPGPGARVKYESHTGSLLFDWSGDLATTYLVEYDIGLGDHHVEGVYEAPGNHQLLGPFPKELWGNLQAWNPFKIRVSPKSEPRCWSDWVEFRF